MKKIKAVVVVLVLCVAPVMADNLELRILSEGVDYVDIENGIRTNVPLTLEGRLVTGDTDGLAFFAVNLSASGDISFDLCDTSQFLVTCPVAVSEFDRNEGLTNPPDMASSGFSGTCDGENGLWQIGGGQNTIGNFGPTLYPVGSVETGIGNSGWHVLAEGFIEVTLSSGEQIVLTLDTGLANTLDIGGGPNVYAVTDSPVQIIGDLTIEVRGHCHNADVDCSGAVGAGDIIAVQNSLNWGFAAGVAANPRADVDGSGTVGAGDILAIQNSANWGQSVGPCTCP